MICEECDHLLKNHVGPVDMGGGNIEPVGCLENDETGEQCLCLNYDKGGDF